MAQENEFGFLSEKVSKVVPHLVVLQGGKSAPARRDP